MAKFKKIIKTIKFQNVKILFEFCFLFCQFIRQVFRWVYQIFIIFVKVREWNLAFYYAI